MFNNIYLILLYHGAQLPLSAQLIYAGLGTRVSWTSNRHRDSCRAPRGNLSSYQSCVKSALVCCWQGLPDLQGRPKGPEWGRPSPRLMAHLQALSLLERVRSTEAAAALWYLSGADKVRSMAAFDVSVRVHLSSEANS